jgi:hypothetical protein
LTRLLGSTGARGGSSGTSSTAALLLVFTWIPNPMLAVLVMSLSSFAAEFSGPVSWTTAMDIGGKHVGTVSGFMNRPGQLGRSVAPAVRAFPLLASETVKRWRFRGGLIQAAARVCWILIIR